MIWFCRGKRFHRRRGIYQEWTKYRQNFVLFFFLIFTILSKFESISSFIITYIYIYIDLPLQEFDFVETVSRSLHLYKYYFAETFETTESLEYFHITLVTYKFIIDRDFDSTKLLLRYIYIYIKEKDIYLDECNRLRYRLSPSPKVAK